ncbi:GTP-binding protein (I) alpha subunit, partial [Reticulomyxa filosa]
CYLLFFFFLEIELILFLNKKDLFIEELKKKPLGICFTKAAGWDEEQWEGPDYFSTNNKEKDDEYFNVCYEAAIKFIQDVFVSRNEVESRVVFCHVTMATDQKCIETVFWDVQNTVIRSNLRKGGLII